MELCSLKDILGDWNNPNFEITSNYGAVLGYDKLPDNAESPIFFEVPTQAVTGEQSLAGSDQFSMKNGNYRETKVMWHPDQNPNIEVGVFNRRYNWYNGLQLSDNQRTASVKGAYVEVHF